MSLRPKKLNSDWAAARTASKKPHERSGHGRPGAARQPSQRVFQGEDISMITHPLTSPVLLILLQNPKHIGAGLRHRRRPARKLPLPRTKRRGRRWTCMQEARDVFAPGSGALARDQWKTGKGAGLGTSFALPSAGLVFGAAGRAAASPLGLMDKASDF